MTKIKEPKPVMAGIEETIKTIQSRFGEGAIMKLGDQPKVGVGAISTGSLGLDLALGIGGVNPNIFNKVLGLLKSDQLFGYRLIIFANRGDNQFISAGHRKIGVINIFNCIFLYFGK